MSVWTFSLLFLGGCVALSWPLGRYLAWAMHPGPQTGPLRRRLEGLLQVLAGPAALKPQDWKEYLRAMLAWNVLTFCLGFAILALQGRLPLNPDGLGTPEGSLIFNTVASFVSNTNLQHYSGEATYSYLGQLGALMWLQFVSAGTGLAALAAMSRGLTGHTNFGNFLVDLQRAILFVLLPMALVVALVFALGGMPMTLQGAVHATTLEGGTQVIARGPVAAFVAIKQLGTNGGGFFGPNCTHPFENPTIWTNLVAMAGILLLPMACVLMFGHIIGRTRHAVVVFGVMLSLLLIKVLGAVYFEQSPTQAFAGLPAVVQSTANLEGKELRLGAATGPLWAVLTTCTSNGSVAAMHDSLNPLTGLFPMVGMWLNATFGGVGVGMINMLVYIIVAVFLAGMMVGRTPEYLNRRLEAREIKLAAVALLCHACFILVGTAVFSVTAWGTQSVGNSGPHGFSEILYEFSSASANNGSGFEGLADNTPAWNIATGVMMLLARFVPIILPLAIAGSLAAKRPTATSAGTLGTEDMTFAIMLLVTILIVGALTFFPAAALGPIVEHLKFMV